MSLRRRSGYNPKRKIAPNNTLTQEEIKSLAENCDYGGNPEHKRDPGDYGLTPPRSPRPGKTLCDVAGKIMKADALLLLRSGIEKGMVSPERKNGWPQNIWAVSNSGDVFVAFVCLVIC